MSQDIYVVIEHFQDKVTDLTYAMLAAAHSLAQGTGGKVKAVLLGHEAEQLAEDLKADQVLYGDHPDLKEFAASAYIQALSELIPDHQPRAVIFGSTTIGSDLADILSMKLNLPVVSSVITVGPDGTLTSKICGGKIFAESQLADPTTLVSLIPGGYKAEEGQADQAPEIVPIDLPDFSDLQIKLLQYIEPETADVDITQESVLVAIGRGIQTEDNVELAEELAELLNGAVCASRPVVDQGWLPISRMVGKSGKSVSPKIYLALGISGAPEHVEGFSESETVIAVNMDPDAPIFDVATYGIEYDLFDLIDPLLDEIEAARS